MNYASKKNNMTFKRLKIVILTFFKLNGLHCAFKGVNICKFAELVSNLI